MQCHVPQDGRTERQAAGSERTSDGFFSSDVRRSAAPLRTETAVAATEEDHITSSGDGGPFHALTAHVSERTELGMKGGRGYTIYTLPATVQGREWTSNGNLNGRLAPGMTSLSLANSCGSAYAVEDGFIDSYDLSFHTTLNRKWLGECRFRPPISNITKLKQLDQAHALHLIIPAAMAGKYEMSYYRAALNLG